MNPTNPTTPHTITLYRADGSWMARDNDPQVRELFGTDVLETAFTDQAPAAEVLQRIQRRNPAADVRLAADEIE